MAAEQHGQKDWTALNPELSKETVDALMVNKFLTPTPVQETCIPLFMSNKDVVAEAVTGSGKTLAFVIPIIEILAKREESLKRHQIGAIIITPTRELAVQIDKVLKLLLKDTPLRSHLVFVGGTDPFSDIDRFRSNGAHIVVATPGRFLDLLKRKNEQIDLRSCVKSLEILVLDEADRLLDMGFKTSINTILSYLPKQRRTTIAIMQRGAYYDDALRSIKESTGLFSATQTKETEDLVRAGLRNPVKVIVKDENVSSSGNRTPSTLQNYYVMCESNEKLSQLVAFLKLHKDEKHIVFFNTCACVEYFSRILKLMLKKIDLLSLHGKMKGKRSKIFDDFQQKSKGIMICTDVMARGVDIPEVHWVIQFDPPSNASSFLHRCGRTARIGNTGKALVFLNPKEESFVDFIKINQKVPLEEFPKLDHPENVSSKLKKLATKDRDLYEKGMRAFVSFIQAYKKHECSLIFQFKELDIEKLANGFGLLQLPKMPELKGKTFGGFERADIEIDSIPYMDKNREKQRQIRLVKKKEEKLDSDKNKRYTNKPWSKQKEKKIKKQQRKEKKENLKRKREIAGHTFDADDVDELSKEIGLMKKLKRGKITKEEFDLVVNDDEEDSSL